MIFRLNGCTLLSIASAILCASPWCRADDAATPPATQPTEPTVEMVDIDPAPTTITMHLKDIQAKEALDELGKQAGAVYRIDNNNGFGMNRQFPTVVVDIDQDHASYWDAFRDICKQFNLSPNNNGGRSGAIMLQRNGDRSWMNQTVSANGPIQFAIQQITRTNSVDVADKDTVQRQLVVNLLAWPEPKLRMVSGIQRVKITEATDDKGHSLALPADPNQGMFYNGPSQEMWMQMQAPLSYPEDLGTRLTSLKGVMPATVATKVARVQVPNLASGRSFALDAGTMSLIIGPAQQQGSNNLQLPFKVRFQGEPAPDPNTGRAPRGRRIAAGNPVDQAKQQQDQAQLQAVIASIRVFDAKGRAYNQNGWGGGGGNGRSVNYTLNYYYYNNGNDEVAPADHLTCDVPAETKDIDFPFEFTNLPLP